MIIYSNNPNFKPIELDIKCELGEYINIEDKGLPKWAYQYADLVLNCRWRDIGKPEVEDVIGRDPRWAYYYAIDVLKCRWADIGKPEVENAISKDLESAYKYFIDTLKKTSKD